MATKTGKKVAIVGSGPAGLVCAHLLYHLGHSVTLFEKEDRLGGMMSLAIPAFRLPDDICKSEIDALIPDEIDVRLNQALGLDLDIESLKADYDALILAIGCTDMRSLGIKGEDLSGCRPGLDFVKEAKRGNITGVGERVLVIGGGFTAIDCARIALRLGSKSVAIAIRRTRGDMTVRDEDIEDTLEEGVELLESLSPTLIKERDGELCVSLIRNRIRMDDSDKRVAQHVPGTEISRHVDQVIIAIGQKVDESFFKPDNHRPGSESGKAELDSIYLVGDCAIGPASIIDAVGHAKELVARIDKDLSGEDRHEVRLVLHDALDTPRQRDWDFIERIQMPKLEPAKRSNDLGMEVELGYNDALAAAESRRCYFCDLQYSIRSQDCIYCSRCVEECPQLCIHYSYGGSGSGFAGWIRRNLTSPKGISIDPDPCIRCGICLKVCPVDCIDVRELSLELTS